VISMNKNSAEVMAILSPLATEERQYDARSIIWHTGDHIPEILLIKEGWAFRYNLLFDGRRQIFSVFTASDLVSPRLVVAPQVSYSLQTLTKMRALVIDRERMREALNTDEKVSDIFSQLWYSQDLYYDKRMIELGRLNAVEKICAFLIRLIEKLDSLGLGKNGTYEVPITREVISDLLGLTSVHVSRTMKQLENAGAVEWTRRSLKILSIEAIQKALPKFHPATAEFSRNSVPRV